MSYPKNLVVPNSELPLWSLVNLMRVAAEQPNCDAVEVQLPVDYLVTINPAPLTFDTYGRRRMRLNELCKEALPYITMMNEIRDEKDTAVDDAANARAETRKANEEVARLNELLQRYAPELFHTHDE